MKKYVTMLPLFLCVLLAGFFWRALKQDPHILPSVLLNKPMPTFSLSVLNSPKTTVNSQALLGKVALIHFWASWCANCKLEHPLLMEIAKAHIPIYGIAYKDTQADLNAWLHAWGNPYTYLLNDERGRAAIDWGVYGTPETFLIDKRGFVRFKQIGLLDVQTWQTTVLPLIKKLENA